MKSIRNRKTQRTQRRITGCDRKHDNAKQSNDTADRSKDILTYNTDRRCRQRSIRRLQAQVVNTHSSCRPYHSDKAFQNHHIIERHTSLALTLHRSGDDRCLCRMESGKDTAGYGNKEYRDKVIRFKIITVRNQCAVPTIPQFDQRIAMDKQSHKNANCRKQQNSSKYRVNPTDDLIDWEYRSHQIIHKDYTIDHPGGNGSRFAVEAEHLCRRNVARCIDKHRSYQEKQKAAENLVKSIDAFVAVPADHIRHLGSAVTQADHSGKIVVHGAADDVSDRNRNKGDRSKQNSLDRSKDRSGSGNIQQVDQTVLPFPHRHIIHTVLLRISRCLSVVRFEYMLTESSIQHRADKQNHKSNNKSDHNKSPPLPNDFSL